MYKKFKALKRSSRLLIIAVIFLVTGVAAYAAISALLAENWSSNLSKGDLFEMELKQPDVTGEVKPTERRDSL